MPEQEKQARERLVDSFWELLADLPYRKVTVGKLVDRAGCNRATFYYHYQDLDDLLLKALDAEFAKFGGIAAIVHRSVTSGPEAFASVVTNEDFGRIVLAAQKVGFADFSAKLRLLTEGVWTTVLCASGQRLAPEAKAILDFVSDGTAGWLIRRPGDRHVAHAPFASDTLALQCEHLAALYGITKDELLARLEMVARLRTSSL